MPDLISRAAAIEEIARRDTTDGTVKVYSGREINAILSDLPAVDAVPVVRCRDCKRAWHSNGMLDCFNGDYGPLSPVDPDWFCADGERRDDDEQADC